MGKSELVDFPYSDGWLRLLRIVLKEVSYSVFADTYYLFLYKPFPHSYAIKDLCLRLIQTVHTECLLYLDL